MDCYDLLILLSYQRGEGDALERAKISSHLLTGCHGCRESLLWLKKIESAILEDDSFDFPEDVIALTVARFREWTEEPVAERSRLRKLIATLIFDSLRLPQMADVRSSAGLVSSRQVLYRTEGYDIDLRFELSDDPNSEQLIGQVLPERWDATELLQFQIQLLQNDKVVSATHTNARGIFTIIPLDSGTYDLRVTVPDGEINLEQVPTARAS